LRVEGPGLRQVEGAAKAAEHPALLFKEGCSESGSKLHALPNASRRSKEPRLFQGAFKALAEWRRAVAGPPPSKNRT